MGTVSSQHVTLRSIGFITDPLSYGRMMTAVAVPGLARYFKPLNSVKIGYGIALFAVFMPLDALELGWSDYPDLRSGVERTW